MSVIQEINKKGAKTIPKQREVAFNYLFGTAREYVLPGNFYFFEYNPKFKANLKHWDKYPLVLITDVYKDGFMGANFHYTTPKKRTIIAQKYLNRTMGTLPDKLFHRYIVKRADNLFFEVSDNDLIEYAALPLEQFYDSKNRFVSAKKVQFGNSR